MIFETQTLCYCTLYKTILINDSSVNVKFDYKQNFTGLHNRSMIT